MKILLTNDDGYKAHGINEMFKALSEKHDTTMIAPDRERSSCGHAITLTKALRLEKFKDNCFHCSGFPADCILMGVGHVFKGDLPDIVISGPNHGANLGQDRFYSGTMAAAREASFRNLPAISISLALGEERNELVFDNCQKYISKLLEGGIKDLIPKGAILNINVPNIDSSEIKGVKLTRPGLQIYTEDVLEREDFRGSKYYWVGGRYDGYEDLPGSDCNEVYNGYISVDLQFVCSNHGEANMEEIKRVINCF